MGLLASIERSPPRPVVFYPLDESIAKHLRALLNETVVGLSGSGGKGQGRGVRRRPARDPGQIGPQNVIDMSVQVQPLRALLGFGR